MTIGEKVRAAREAKGWTRRKLSIQTGYTEIWLGRIENGQSQPSERCVKALERALRISLKEENDEE